MKNKRLWRTAKKFYTAEAFVDHVMGFLSWYQVPAWVTKQDLRNYFEQLKRTV